MIRTVLFLVGVAILLADTSFADDRVILSLQQLHDCSDAIAVGRLDRTKSEWLDGRILTRHRFTATEVWAGKRIVPDKTFDVTTLGGTVGEIGQRVSGQVSLPGVGAELAMFLVWDAKSDSFRFAGTTQGVFNVKRAPDELDGLIVRDQFARNIDQSFPVLTLGELREKVKQLEKRSGQRP